MSTKITPYVPFLQDKVKVRLQTFVLFILLAVTTSACNVQSKETRQEAPVSRIAAAERIPEPVIAPPKSIAYVQALDRMTWLVADFDRVWRTEDGGQTWLLTYGLRPGEAWGQHVAGLSFINSKTGFLVFDRNVLRTDDAGVSWSEQGKLSFDATSCYFTDALQGWAVGSATLEGFTRNTKIPQHIGVVFKTNDSGRTWRQQKIDLPAGYFEEGTRWYLSDVYFSDQRTGWAVGFAVIFWTADGGESWHVADAWKGQYQRVRFLDKDFGWATQREGAEFSITADGGKHWTLLDGAPAYGAWPTSALFITRDHGFSSLVRLYETKDGGRSWKLRTPGEKTTKGYTYLDRAQDGTLVALGLNDGTIAASISTDDGATWQPKG